MSARKRTLLQRIVNRRRIVQALLGVATWYAVAHYGVSLWWVVLVGSVSGVLLGKYFCRWVCPMGAIMEIMLGAGDGKQRSLYSYFKLGCPIAWAGGALNKLSFLRVHLEESKCVHCKLCDKACYVAELSDGRSLHEGGKLNASTHYACSRCLQCVSACPTGALGLKPSWAMSATIPIPAENLVRAGKKRP